MTKKLLGVLAILGALLVVGVGPAGAVVHGQLDGNGHPAVVLVVMDVSGVPTDRCSGTLIAPQYVLTAGHCVGEVGEYSGIRIFTQSDVQSGIGTTNNYPYCNTGDLNCVEADRWAAFPGFTEAAFYLHDVGMIHLSAAVNLPTEDYGTLPSAGQLDSLHPGTKTVFTAVGYGAQRAFPAQGMSSQKNLASRVRMVAYPHLLQINNPTLPQDLVVSGNAHTGGTCYGDSGGPNFIGDTNVIAGVTSAGKNPTCAGQGSVFRLDQPAVLDFISTFMSPT